MHMQDIFLYWMNTQGIAFLSLELYRSISGHILKTSWNYSCFPAAVWFVDIEPKGTFKVTYSHTWTETSMGFWKVLIMGTLTYVNISQEE